MRLRLIAPIACWILIATGCASLAQPACETPGSVRVYQAGEIKEQWINYLWIEIPKADTAGTFPGRLFVASANPTGAVVPSMLDLPCELASGKAAVDYLPAPVEIELDGNGGLQTNYSWRSCSRCSQCYMVWDFELVVQGHTDEGGLVADVVLNETFHEHPMKLGSLRLPEVTSACTQPYLSCRAGGVCSEIKYEKRP